MGYKHDYDKILTRLSITLARLNDGEALSVKELAQEFNVSTKTIQRDFNERLSAFHIYQDGRKWKMQEGFAIEKTQSFKEQLVLDIMQKMTESIGGNFATTSAQLLAKLKNDEFNPIYTKLNIEDISDKFDEIKLLEETIKDKNIISCLYDNEVDSPKTEIFKPLKIVNYEGFWYLVALDENDYVRKCYLKNISNIKKTDETFQSDTKLEVMLENSINIWFQSDREPFEVKILASAVASKYFKRRPLPTQVVESINEDGSMVLTITITYQMEIIPVIKYWIPHLKVLEPLWIKELIDKDLNVYLNFNN